MAQQITFETDKETRNNLLNQIKAFGYDSGLFERYQNSELKKVVDEIKHVEVEATATAELRKDITKWIVMGIVGIIAGIIIIKKL